MKRKIFKIILFISIIYLLFYCSFKFDNWYDKTYNNIECDKEEVKFQEKMSMDFDIIDSYYLLKIAQFYGGNLEDRIYTILVTLNRCYETKESIQKIVLDELYNVHGITEYEFEEIVPDDITKEALNNVMINKIDNSNGSTEYNKKEE